MSNHLQDKFISALLEQNDLAREAGDPHIQDPDKARQAFANIAGLIDTDAATKICDSIASGEFDTELQAENEQGAATGAHTGRLEYAMMLAYMYHTDPSGPKRKAFWSALRAVDLLILPEVLFCQVMQSPITNMLSRFIFGHRQLVLNDQMTIEEEQTIIARNFKRYYFKLENALELSKKGRPNTDTIKLFDFLLNNFADTRNPHAIISIEEYARRCKVDISNKNIRDEFIKNLKLDLDALAALSVNWEYNKKRFKFSNDAGAIRFEGGFHAIKGGYIYWDWGERFVRILEDLAPMDFHDENFCLSGNAYFLARYFDINYRLNYDKPPQLNKCTIRKLLEEAPLLPSYERLKEQRKSRKERLMIPLFQALNSIPHLKYSAYTKDGTPIDVARLLAKDKAYKLEDIEFLDGYIIVDYSKYPPHDHRIMQKERHKQAKLLSSEKAKAANATKSRVSKDKKKAKK